MTQTLNFRKQNTENGLNWQSTCITTIMGNTKARGNSSFLNPWSTLEILKSSSSPLYFIVVLKMNSKTQERDKALTHKKRKKLCCYGSVYSELLKFGAYLYFKTNRDHINNSRCCKGRIEFIIGRSTLGSEAIGASCGGSRMDSCNLARNDSLLDYRPGWEHSVVPISVGWIHVRLCYSSHTFLVGPRRYFQNWEGGSNARKTSNDFEGARRRLIFATMIGGIYLFFPPHIF